jgi:pimeloyl-ACP methyl ester carboxylesterase
VTGHGGAAAIDGRTFGTTDGAEIAYRFRPGRDPWVLLHGLACDGSMWDDVVAHLPPDAGLVIPDLRGHGGSTLGWRLPSIALWAEDVAAILDHERIEAPAVAGLSMGGYTAMALAAAEPGRARAFGFVSTQARPDDEAGRRKRAEGLALLRREGWRAYAEGLVPLLFAVSRPDHAAQRDRFMKMAQRAGEAGLAATLFALANRADRRAALASLRRPAVAIVGAEDRLTPPDRSHEIAAIAPRCRTVVLPGVAHMSATEDPRGVARALDETGMPGVE